MELEGCLDPSGLHVLQLSCFLPALGRPQSLALCPEAVLEGSGWSVDQSGCWVGGLGVDAPNLLLFPGNSYPLHEILGALYVPNSSLTLKPSSVAPTFGSAPCRMKAGQKGNIGGMTRFCFSKSRALQTRCALFPEKRTCCLILNTQELCLPPTRES